MPSEQALVTAPNTPPLTDAAHAAPAAEVCSRLGVDPAGGLAHAEAARRLEAHGLNRLPEVPPPSRLTVLARQFTNSMVALLAGAGAISLAIGEAVDAAVIAAIVVANGALGYVQEQRAEAATAALRRLLGGRARVIRGGEPADIPVEEVAVGDLVLLAAGDRVPADGRVLQAVNVEIDESALTGESLPVTKRAEPPAPAASMVAERPTIAHAGTSVVRGSARIAVTGTGADTEVGRIAAGAAVPSPKTPLQTRLDGFSALLLRGAGIVCLALAALSWAYGEPLGRSLLVGVSLAVAAVPEGLPAVVTVTLALGMRRMAEAGAIVRRLHAVETLGSTTVVCSDKTGTLTENRLRLTRAWSCAEGELDPQAPAPSLAPLLAEALRASEEMSDDPVDVALAEGGARAGVTQEDLLAERRRVALMPFDSERKRMGAVHEDVEGRRTASVKGAPEVVAGLLSSGDGDAIERRALEWAADGVRVLLVARRDLGAGATDPERDLEPVGLLGFADAPRPRAAASVRRAREAGVRTVMITGDHPATALAVARATGIATAESEVITGAELDALDDDGLDARIEAAGVFARVEPAHKVRIVQALQRRGHVVAMTGDGVNDVPALAAAHIGVAMGGRGTDAAIEAADMVLTDDDYATIVVAIERGRGLYDNILRFFLFLLAANAGEVLVFALAVTAALGAPLTVLQILLVNLLTDGLPALALGADPPDPDVMRRPPRRLSEGLLEPIAGRLAVVAAASGAAAFASLLIGEASDHATGQTMAYITLVFGQLAYVATVRGERPFWRAGRNPALWWAVGLSAAIGAATLLVGALRRALDLVVLEPGLAMAALGLALVPAATAELHKAWRRRRAAGHPGIPAVRSG